MVASFPSLKSSQITPHIELGRKEPWHEPFSEIFSDGGLVESFSLVQELGHILRYVVQHLILNQVLNALQ